MLSVVAAGALWLTGAGAYAIWWATNTTPPAVSLAVPPNVVRGNVTIDVQLDPSGRSEAVEVTVDGRPLSPGAQVLVETATLPDGPHQISVVAQDSSFRQNRTTATATLTTDNTPPRLTIESQPQRVQQGHTWLLRIRSDEQASVQARLGDRDLPIQAGNGFGWAVVGFAPNAEPRSIPVTVAGRDPAGNEAEVSEPLHLEAEAFPSDAVQVEPNLAQLLSSEIRTEEDRRLAEYYQRVTEPKLWEGRFVMPVQGEIITEFGSVRSYNGGPTVGHHNGADIASGQGRNVVAPARGKVILVDNVRLRGTIVILEHGLGVFTTYAHLSAVDVQVGQLVERGQPFAQVGSTGLSTGPHLHWELWVKGANVNPLEWTERDIP